MTERTKPPFRADQVGSLIRPDALIKAREAAEKNEIPAAEFRRIQEGAIRDVVRLQEEIGLKVVTDGEFNRKSWQRDFLLKFKNVTLGQAAMRVRFHTAEGQRDHVPPSLLVSGKLSRPGEIFVDDFRFLKSVSKATPKVTIPSPTVMHFRGGRGAIDAKAYPDISVFYDDLARVYREEIADLAKAGCRYLQIDEVNLAYLCDPALRAEVANFGEDPETLPKTYAKLLNDTIAGKPADMTVCMHLCRGNFAGAWVAEGGYEPVAELLFNEINVDGYFLEYDSPRAGGFEPLRFLPKGKVAVLGLVTTKSPKLESKDELKRRIDEAARFVPLEQLALSPQCGFSSGIGGNAVTYEDEIKKLRLVVETAREVWGSA
ncbi:MAG TPA: 5-methyltetrahydropteroyltriglutamate--homocysteine S-methyltransferase [Xanthobacteraceae bacterium]|jgi:5-methyltetrahydropteroyltriglutamate--homocysteine methyltransferase